MLEAKAVDIILTWLMSVQSFTQPTPVPEPSCTPHPIVQVAPATIGPIRQVTLRREDRIRQGVRERIAPWIRQQRLNARLWVAAHPRNPACTLIRRALSQGANPDFQGPTGDRIIHRVAASGNEEAMQIIIDAGADIHALDSAERTALSILTLEFMVQQLAGNIDFKLILDVGIQDAYRAAGILSDPERLSLHNLAILFLILSDGEWKKFVQAMEPTPEALIDALVFSAGGRTFCAATQPHNSCRNTLMHFLVQETDNELVATIVRCILFHYPQVNIRDLLEVPNQVGITPWALLEQNTNPKVAQFFQQTKQMQEDAEWALRQEEEDAALDPIAEEAAFARLAQLIRDADSSDEEAPMDEKSSSCDNESD